MSASKPDPTEMKAMRQWARRSDKVSAILDRAILQQLRELLWTTLQKGDPDLKEVRTIVSCMLDARRMIAMNDARDSKEKVFGPGEQEEAVFRIFGELPEPERPAAALLEEDITATSAAPAE